MINFRFTITNPWWDRFASIKHWHGKTPFKHKCWELQLLKSDDIVAYDLRISARSDHAGLDLWLGLFGYSMNFIFYDNRHWNIEEGAWEVYNEQPR